MDSESSQNPSSSSGSTATPQVRSRITVVCAECKRLKLKCDRKNPCGSCVKRDTTARCIYSPAAAEKVDLHSLNNRLIQVESLLAQFTSGQFPPQPPSMARASSSSTSMPSNTAQPPSVTPLPYTSLALSLDDVAAIWLDHLNVTTRLTLRGTQASTKNGIKLESNDYPVLDYCKPLPATSIYYEMTPRHNTLPFPSSPSPGVDPSVRPSITRALLDLLPPTVSDSPIPTLQSLLALAEQSTIHTYPSTNWKHFRSRVSHMVAILKPPPFNSSDTFKERDRDKGKHRGRKDANQAREVHYNSRTGNPLPPFTPASAPPNSSKEYMEPPAKSEGLPFFGAVCAALALGALESSREAPQSSVDAMQVDSYPRPSASLRGASSGTYLDAEYWYRMSVHVLNEYERGLAANVNSQTKGVESFGQDYLLACLFQVSFMVKGGLGPAVVETAGTYHAKAADGISGGRRRREKERDKSDDRASNLGGVAAIVFPLVGKMVNIARDLGLAKDPPEVLASALDSFKKARNRTEAGDSPPAISNLFDAEMRRRIWWDIFYYDVFVSDALGHEPLIGDDFPTKMPVGDVDEKVFSSVSTRIPPLQDLASGTGYHRDGFHYFQAKCRLALVVRKIQRRMCTSEMTTTLFSYGSGTSSDSKNGYGYSIDQAASMETEVTQWLEDLPEMYRLEKCTVDLSMVDPILAIQRCELAITAQRLILKIYMPFLRKHASVSETVRPPHQATCGSVNAAHLVVRASNLLFSVWTRGMERPLPPSMISPAMFDFYPFTRVLLDSGVVCAHAAIKQFVPMMAPAAEDALDTVLKILQDPNYPSRLGGVDGFGSGHDVSVADAVKLLKELKQHAVDARGSMGPTLKRKHDDVEDDESADVDELESEEVEYAYVDADKPQSPIFSDLLQPPPESSSPISVTRSPIQAMQPDMCMGAQSYETLSKGKDDKGKKSKRAQPHPVVGIRHRGSADGSPLAKRRLSPAMVSDTETQPQPTSNSPFTKQPIYPSSIHSQPMSQPSSLIPSPLHLSTLEAEKYRSRSSSLTQPVDSGPFTRRESASSVGSYSSYQSTSSPRPIDTVPRRYTTSSTQPPPMPQPSLPSPQSQPSLQSAYAVASHPTNLYDRASSYESQRGYAEPQGDAYAPAQSPYVASGSPYTTTSGPLSNASSPYTQTSTNMNTPAYPSPRGQNIPLSNGSSATYYAGYESGTPVSAGSYHNPFTGNGGGYDQEPMGDVKPSMQVDSYREPQPVYQPQTQWEPQQQQQPQQHQYWQAQAPVNYYPAQ